MGEMTRYSYVANTYLMSLHEIFHDLKVSEILSHGISHGTWVISDLSSLLSTAAVAMCINLACNINMRYGDFNSRWSSSTKY